MRDNLVYPFERNRYYSGKMLTSADFIAEQSYMNGKRRFMNTMVSGSGIVCGCGVFSLDDLSVLVESGVAIDEQGREIIIDTSVVKKLSAIEGFVNVESNEAILGLKYDEEPVHSVYSVGGDGKEGEYEFNRISEKYKLFLMDAEAADAGFAMEDEFLAKEVLFVSADFKVELIVPTIAAAGKNYRMLVKTTKLSDDQVSLSYTGILQTPAFLNADDSNETEISLSNITLAKGESVEKSYWLKASDVATDDTSIVLKADSHKAAIDEVSADSVSGISIRVRISADKPRTIVDREIGKLSLEMRLIGGMKDFIPLAKLKLVRNDQACLIEKVIEDGIKNYISVPAADGKRNEYLEFFVKENDIHAARVQSVNQVESPVKGTVPGSGIEVATGVLDIPLNQVARKGDISYSGEIIHGLGKGNVYVSVGYEYISEDEALGSAAKSTVYGNMDLFAGQNQQTVATETAVKVLNDKGSFVVAAKLLQDVDFLVLSYRWVAIKFPSGNDMGLLEEFKDRSISAETPTVMLGTKESYYFAVKCHNMDQCSISYELTEPGSGFITAEGVYTAPNKEGVYEIRIYCTEMPFICTYAYAVVKKSAAEEKEEQAAQDE